MQKTENLLQEVEKQDCIKYYDDFLLKACRILNPYETIVQNWHINYICNRLQKEIERIGRGEKRTKHIIINIPPRSLKSLMASVCLPAWAWINYPELKFISTSYSESLSLEHNVMTRRIVESEWYQKNFNLKITTDQNTKHYFENIHSGYRMCSSTGGSITGKGANIIFIDDPTDPQRAFSEVERDKSIRYFAQTLSTRLNRPDIDMFFIIMQRLHENDLTGWLIANMPDAFEVISIPATSEGNIIPSDLIRFYKDGLFFPDRFSKEVVSNLRLSLGMYGYSGQMEQQPAPVEGGMIKKTYFKIIDSAPQQINWNYTIDGAYTENEKNDPTAILAYGMKDGNMYICNVESVWMEFPDLMKEVVRFTQWNGYSNRSRIFIEPKASGLPAVQILKRETMLNVIADKPPTTDKITRVNACLPFLESGRVILIRGAWNDSFIHQCCTFPNATHDDEVDCLTMAISREQTNSQIISVAL